MKDLTYPVIKTQEQYENYTETLYELMMKEEIDERTQEHIDQLLILIKAWDSETYDGKDYNPVEIIKALIDEHDLNQKKFSKIIDKSESYVSEIINYKKYPSKNVIRAIANHFKISQEALNKPYKLDINNNENSVIIVGFIQKEQYVKDAQYIPGKTAKPTSSESLFNLKSRTFN